MKFAKTLLTAAALAVVLGGSAYAKTLVYCSEASPANFDPASRPPPSLVGSHGRDARFTSAARC